MARAEQPARVTARGRLVPGLALNDKNLARENLPINQSRP